MLTLNSTCKSCSAAYNAANAGCLHLADWHQQLYTHKHMPQVAGMSHMYMQSSFIKDTLHDISQSADPESLNRKCKLLYPKHKQQMR